MLLEHVFLLADLSEPRMLQGLRSCYAVISVIDEQLFNQICDFRARLGDQFGDAGSFNSSEAELGEIHVRGVTLELIQERLIGCAQDMMDLVHLVKFIIAGEEREKGNDLEHDTADAPKIHLVAVITVR